MSVSETDQKAPTAASGLYVHRLGDEKAVEPRTPGLIALHGFLGSGLDFKELSQALNAPIIAPDLPGHGESSTICLGHDQDVKHDFNKLCVALERSVESPSIKNVPIPLLGYSMGGRFALHWAIKNQARFSSLILIGAHPGLKGPEDRRARQRADENWAQAFEHEALNQVLERWGQQDIIRSQNAIPEPLAKARHKRRLSADPRGWAECLRRLGTGRMPPLWERLKELDLPVLLLTGSEDKKFGALARRMRELLPYAEHHQIRGAGHCPLLEKASDTTQQLRKFIERHSPQHHP